MSVRRTVITFKYELTVGALKKCEWNLLNIVNWKLDMVLSIAWGNIKPFDLIESIFDKILTENFAYNFI